MYCLPKSCRLHLRRSVEELFSKGKSFVAYPLRVVYLVDDSPPMGDLSCARAQMMVSVSKKYFKRATKRNRIKRLVREAYRLHQAPLVDRLTERDRYIRIGWINVAREQPDYADVARGVRKGLRRIVEREGLIVEGEDLFSPSDTDTASLVEPPSSLVALSGEEQPSLEHIPPSL